VRGRRRAGSSPDAPVPGFFYLEKALNPRGTAEGEFTVRTIDERDLTASVLPARGVVVWVDPQRLEEKRLALLERYVDRGGGLMVFLGEGDRSLWQSREFQEFLGMHGAVERTGEVKVGYTSFRQDHPIFSIFSDEELELLSRTRVRSYVSASGVAPDSTLAYIGGGDPAVWECSRGQGHVLVFAAAPDLESGDIPLSPMFLPLVHTSVSYLASAGTMGRQGENYAGHPVFFDANPAQGARLTVRTPDGGLVEPATSETPHGDERVVYQRPLEVGFYRLQSDTTALAEAVVNLDTRESDLATRSLVTRDERAHVVDTGGDFSANLREKRQGREIFAFFILLAAAALAAESVLGRRA
jgi:hypothetical protein